MTLPSFADTGDMPSSCGADAVELAHVLWVVSTAVRGVAGKSFVDEDGELIATGLAADQLRSVTIEAASRRLRNPDGATARSEGLGPFSESVTIDAGNIYFTKAEREQIAAAASEVYPSSGFAGIGTISTTRGPLETASWCDEGIGDPIADDPFNQVMP